MTQTLIGYARVSTEEQKLDSQIDLLEQAGAHRIFTDKISGAKAERPGLSDALAYLREGDTLVVYKLCRLGRSMKQLVSIITELKERGIQFKSLSEGIDTSTNTGELVFNIFSSLAVFERELIREGTRAGMAAARRRGISTGRPRKLTDKQVQLAKVLYSDNSLSVREICHQLGCSRNTLLRAVKPAV